MKSAEDLGIEGLDEIETLDIEGSAIYRARQFRHNRTVAVKILDAHQEPLVPKRFDLRRKQHQKFAEDEGVVSLYQQGVTSGGEQYIMMPFFRIGSLADQLDHGSMPWHRAAELMMRTSEIVARAHDLGIALGDLKPSSVMLADASSPMISMYGMATRRIDDGTPSYRAPETNRGSNPSPTADVYSLSLTLASLIAGRPPNRGPLSAEFLSEVGALAPIRIVQVIERGLSDRSADRYRSARDLATALGTAIQGDQPSFGANGHQHEDGEALLDLDALLGMPPPPLAPPPPGPADAVLDLDSLLEFPISGEEPDLQPGPLPVDAAPNGSEPSANHIDEEALAEPGEPDSNLGEDLDHPDPEFNGHGPADSNGDHAPADETLVIDLTNETDKTDKIEERSNDSANGSQTDEPRPEDPGGPALVASAPSSGLEENSLGTDTVATATGEFDLVVQEQEHEVVKSQPLIAEGLHVPPPPSAADAISADLDQPPPSLVADGPLPYLAHGALADHHLDELPPPLLPNVAGPQFLPDGAEPTPEEPPMAHAAAVTGTFTPDFVEQPPAPLAFNEDQGEVAPFDSPIPDLGDEEIPFRAFERQHAAVAAPSPLLRFIDPLQIAWIQVRRSLGALLALIGFAVIAGVVGMVVLRGPQTATTGPNATFSTVQEEGSPSTFLPTSEAPIFVEPPATHQTTTTRRIIRTTPPTAAPTTAAPTTAAPTTRPATTRPATTRPATTRPATSQPVTSRPISSRPRPTRPPTSATTPSSSPTTLSPTTNAGKPSTTKRNKRSTTTDDDDDILEGPTLPLIEDASVSRIRATTAQVQFSSSSCVTASFSYSASGGSATKVGGGSRCSRSYNLLLGTVTPRLSAGTTYTVSITATDTSGSSATQHISFTTLG